MTRKYIEQGVIIIGKPKMNASIPAREIAAGIEAFIFGLPIMITPCSMYFLVIACRSGSHILSRFTLYQRISCFLSSVHPPTNKVCPDAPDRPHRPPSPRSRLLSHDATRGAHRFRRGRRDGGPEKADPGAVGRGTGATRLPRLQPPPRRRRAVRRRYETP